MLRDEPRLALKREAKDEARLAALRQTASVGLADSAEGRYSVFADGETLRNHMAARADKIPGRLSE